MQMLSRTTFERYMATTTPSVQRAGDCAPGSFNLLFRGRNKAQAFNGLLSIAGQLGSKLLLNAPDGGYAGLGGPGESGIGSIVGLLGKSLAFIGGGQLYHNGVARIGAVALTYLEILLYRNGSYTGSGTGPILAGIAFVPTAPTLAVTAIASTKMNGTYSTVHWYVRSSTGARGVRSLPSRVVANAGFKMRHTISSFDLAYAAIIGADRIGIGVTQAGFGATGPHFELREVAISAMTVSGSERYIDLDWVDAELAGNDLAPIEDYPPPLGVFAAVIQDVLAIIGCYGDPSIEMTATTPGNGISVSLPLHPESFPPDNILFLPEPPVHVLSRASDGFVYILCKNSVHALLYTGGQMALSLRTVWAATGIVAPHNACLASGGRLYAYTAKGGAIRIGNDGEPETAWAADIVEEMAAWYAPKVVVGWDNDTQTVVFGYLNTLLCFNVQTEEWSTPLGTTGLVAGEVCAAVTIGGNLHLTYDTGSSLVLVQFNKGLSGTAWVARGKWHYAQGSHDTITAIDVEMRADLMSVPVNLKVYTNGDLNTPKLDRNITPRQRQLVHLPRQRVNIRNVKSHLVQISHASDPTPSDIQDYERGAGDSGPGLVTVFGVSSEVAI